MRRWSEGMRGEVAGVPLRVVRGTKPYKPEGDLVLEWFIRSNWRPIPMKLGAVLADFFYDNEEFLYPQDREDRDWRGGARYLSYINGAALTGWQQAEALLQKEREERARKNKEVAS